MEAQMETVKLPTPLFGRVIIKNPLFNTVEAHKDALAKLPNEAAKKQYLEDNILQIFDKVEIVKVSADVTAPIAEGCFAIVATEAAQAGDQLLKGEYLMIRETAIRALW